MADVARPRRSRGSASASKAPGTCHIEARRKVNSPNRIELLSHVHFDIVPMRGRDVKIGMKIRAHQRLAQLKLSMGDTVLDVQAEDDPYPIAQELDTVFPHDADERWIAHLVRYSPAFDAKLLEMAFAVENFDAPSHSFQPMPMVFAYLDEPFAGGHFLVAVSILTGVDSLGFQVPVD